MRKQSYLATLLLTIILTGMPVFAKKGTAGPGGGNIVEIAFKNYAIRLGINLRQLSLEGTYKPFFKFDAVTLLGTATTFEPLCADEEQIDFLRKSKKFAYAWDLDNETVLLDCGDYQNGIPKVWRDIFMGDDTNSNILIVHELLRLKGIKDEDAYLASACLSVLDQVKDTAEAKKLDWLITNNMDTQARNICAVTLTNYNFGPGSYPIQIEISKRGTSRAKFKFTVRPDTDDYVRIPLELIDPTAPNRQWTKPLYRALHVLGCFD